MNEQRHGRFVQAPRSAGASRRPPCRPHRENGIAPRRSAAGGVISLVEFLPPLAIHSKFSVGWFFVPQRSTPDTSGPPITHYRIEGDLPAASRSRFALKIFLRASNQEEINHEQQNENTSDPPLTKRGNSRRWRWFSQDRSCSELPVIGLTGNFPPASGRLRRSPLGYRGSCGRPERR